MTSEKRVVPFPKVRRDRDQPQPELHQVMGDVLRAQRLRPRRTLVEVAHESAVSVSYLSETERGRKEPSSVVLRSICDALEVPLPDVLEQSARRLRSLASVPRTGRGCSLRSVVTDDRWPLSSWPKRLTVRGSGRFGHLVSSAVLDGGGTSKHERAVGVGADLLDRVAGVVGQDGVDLASHSLQLVGLDCEVGR